MTNDTCELLDKWIRVNDIDFATFCYLLEMDYHRDNTERRKVYA